MAALYSVNDVRFIAMFDNRKNNNPYRKRIIKWRKKVINEFRLVFSYRVCCLCFELSFSLYVMTNYYLSISFISFEKEFGYLHKYLLFYEMRRRSGSNVNMLDIHVCTVHFNVWNGKKIFIFHWKWHDR